MCWLASPARINRIFCRHLEASHSHTTHLLPAKKTGSHASARYIEFSEPTTPWILVISTSPNLIVNGRLGIARPRLPASPPTWTVHPRPAALRMPIVYAPWITAATFEPATAASHSREKGHHRLALASNGVFVTPEE